jgi:hypothetical protein
MGGVGSRGPAGPLPNGGLLWISAAAGGGGEVHFFAVTGDQRDKTWLWQATRLPSGSWRAFADIKPYVGDAGSVRVLAAAPGPGGELQCVAVTLAGGLLHALRHADGTWQPFRDLKPQTGDPGPMVDVAGAPGAGGAVHWAATTGDGHLWHTVRHPDGSWDRFVDAAVPGGPVCRVTAAGQASGDVHYMALTV